MKALSIRAPWWWFILHGGKDIENRDWRHGFRGPVLIHAGKWFKPEEVRDEFEYARRIALDQGRTLPSVTLRQLQAGCGCIVGQARIIDCVGRDESPWFFGRYGFLMVDAKPFAEPIPLKGQLGFFDVPAEVVARLR